MKNAPEAIGINAGSSYARCAYWGNARVHNKNAAPVMIPNRWGKTSMDAKAQDLASLLRTLREDAEVFLGRMVSSCVMSVRARLSPLHLEAMTRAAGAAGMPNVNIVTEPLAAALAYGGEGRLMILDVGAGGAEISVVENEGSMRKVLESAGHETGGCGFDAALAEWLRERLGLDPMSGGDPRRRVLLSEAETIKITLSSSPACDWQPPSMSGGDRKFPVIRIEREELERMTRFSIKRLVNAAGRVWEKYTPKRLLLTGGSSRMPLLREMAERGIARPERLNFEPEDAAAAGAALYAAEGKERPPERLGSPPGKGPRALDLKMRLMRMEPSLSPAHQKRLHVMLSKFGNLTDDASSVETLEEIVKELEAELF